MDTNNIKMRKEFDFFEIGDRKFKLKAFDPIEGNYMLIQVLSFVLPLGIGNALSQKFGTESIPTDPGASKIMSKNDFIALERDILSTVDEIYAGGNSSPVVRPNGTYGIENVSMSLFVQLMIASLAFNFKDFFEDIPLLKDFMQGQDLNPANTKT